MSVSGPVLVMTFLVPGLIVQHVYDWNSSVIMHSEIEALDNALYPGDSHVCVVAISGRGGRVRQMMT